MIYSCNQKKEIYSLNNSKNCHFIQYHWHGDQQMKIDGDYLTTIQLQVKFWTVYIWRIQFEGTKFPILENDWVFIKLKHYQYVYLQLVISTYCCQHRLLLLSVLHWLRLQNDLPAPRFQLMWPSPQNTLSQWDPLVCYWNNAKRNDDVIWGKIQLSGLI